MAAGEPSAAPTTSSSPTSSPTTAAPTAEPTEEVVGITCNGTYNFNVRWTRQRRWRESQSAAYLAQADEAFIEDYPQCGDDGSSLEYYYCFNLDGGRLDLYQHICCGDGRSFGAGYSLPDGLPGDGQCEYAENDVIAANAAFIGADDEWTDSDQFGDKQIITFCIIGLIVIGCCAGLGYMMCKSQRGKRIESINASAHKTVELVDEGNDANSTSAIRTHSSHVPL